MRAHNPQLLAEAVLYILYSEAIVNGKKLPSSEIKALLPSETITDTLIAFAISDLRQKKFVTRSLGPRRNELLIISRSGYNYARYRLPLAGTAINNFSKSPNWILGNEEPGDDAPTIEQETNPGLIPASIGDVSDDLEEIVKSYEEIDEFENRSIPASNRTVTLNNNQVEEATKGLDEFVKEFQKDHHFGNEWVAEKGALLKTLEAGQEYLNNKVIDVRIGTMLILEPLKEIVAKYDQAAIGGTISAMAQKLIELLINLFAG
ncbi:MAG: hypothetical protein JKY92_05045 [Magnetovibrio sp.]|nr:hypothetical protein [Magnetovibrio sp.]